MAKKKASKKPKATKGTKTTKRAAGKSVLDAVDTTVEIDIYLYSDNDGQYELFRTAHGEIDTNNKTAVIEWIDNWFGAPMLDLFDDYQLKTGGQTFSARLTSLTYPGSPAAFFKLQ